MLQQIAQNNSRQGATEVTRPPAPAPARVSSPPQSQERAPGAPPSIPRPPATTAATSAPIYTEAQTHSTTVAPPAQAPTQAPFAVPPPASTLEAYSFVPDVSIGDLSQFNFTLFDPTSALHWVRFAQHWHNTYQVIRRFARFCLFTSPDTLSFLLQYIPSNQECLWAMSEF
jgi:hypothetical protein